MSQGGSTLGRGKVPARKTSRSRGPSQETRDTVIRRAESSCERCGSSSAFGWSVHHRQPRGMGGSRVASANSPANLMLLCGSGTTGCHGEVESQRKQAVADGFIVARPGVPETTPVYYRRQKWLLLTADGRTVYWVPERE